MRTGADESCIWNLTPWGNTAPDEYEMGNMANGSRLVVDVEPNYSWLYMNKPNASVAGQQWALTSVGRVDDGAWSTVCVHFHLFSDVLFCALLPKCGANKDVLDTD